jgi:hypothetical protein
MRDHLPQWSARAKPKLALVDSISTICILLMILPEVARAAAPVALKTSFAWDMSGNLVIDKPFGIDIKKWFNFTDVNTTYSSKLLNINFIRNSCLAKIRAKCFKNSICCHFVVSHTKHFYLFICSYPCKSNLVSSGCSICRFKRYIDHRKDSQYRCKWTFKL